MNMRKRIILAFFIVLIALVFVSWAATKSVAPILIRASNIEDID